MIEYSKAFFARFRSHLRPTLILSALVGLSLAVLVSCGSRAPEPLQPTAKERTPKTVVRGHALYDRLCSPCHGIEGKGNGPNAGNLAKSPRNFTDADYMSKKTDQEIFNAINGGGSSVGLSQLMPNWGGTLKDWEIRDLIAYLRRFQKS